MWILQLYSPFFKIVLDILGPFHFHVNFRISFQFLQKFILNFERNYIESKAQLGSTDISAALSPLLCEHAMPFHLFVVVQSLNRVWLFATPWTIVCVLHYIPEFALIPVCESVMSFNHLILCRPLLLLPSVFSTGKGSFPMSWLMFCSF